MRRLKPRFLEGDGNLPLLRLHRHPRKRFNPIQGHLHLRVHIRAAVITLRPLRRLNLRRVLRRHRQQLMAAILRVRPIRTIRKIMISHRRRLKVVNIAAVNINLRNTPLVHISLRKPNLTPLKAGSIKGRNMRAQIQGINTHRSNALKCVKSAVFGSA